MSISDEINERFLENPFTRNLIETYSKSLFDIDQREGFKLNGNNHHLLNDKEKYIIGIQKFHSNLIYSIEQIHFIKVFLKRYPNKEFLSANGINQLTYIQFHTEVLSHKIHTILEIMKLLVNEVYCLNIKPQDCSWVKLISKLDKSILPLKIIDLYFKTFERIIDLRHANSHRGIYSDSEKDEIDLDYGFGVYEMHERLGIKTDDSFKRMFPKFLIDYKIKTYRKKRIDLIKRIQDIIYDLTKDFLTSLNEELERKMNNAPQQAV